MNKKTYKILLNSENIEDINCDLELIANQAEILANTITRQLTLLNDLIAQFNERKPIELEYDIVEDKED